MRHSSTGLCVLAFVAVTAAACGSGEPATAAEDPAPARGIDVAAIRVGVTDLESTLQLSGNLLPQSRVAVSAKLPGTLSSIGVDIGDRVQAGQVVAELDRRDIDAQVDAAEAAVNVSRAAAEVAEAALANAVLEQERARNLFDRGAIPKQRLDAADTARRSASAQRDLATANIAQAEAGLRRAREALRDTTLTSPIDGVIVERHYDAGSLVSPGDGPIVVVADMRVMTLEAGVSELDAGRLRVGMSARLTTQAHPGQTFDGRLAAIAPEVDARNRHFLVEVRVANPRAILLSGMYGAATISLEQLAQVITVPRDAVTTRDGRRVALRINNDTIEEVPVQEGLTDGTAIEITSGLDTGDWIVADARNDLPAGSSVNAVFLE